MKPITKRLFLCLTLIMATVYVFADSTRPTLAASPGCASLPAQSGTLPNGFGRGVNQPFNAGDVVIVTASLNTATNATFRLFGGAVGSPNTFATLAGPTNVPGTLTFTIPTTGNWVVGFEVTSGDGTVDLQAGCSSDPTAAKLFTDGRVNPEAQATVVAYCNKPNAGDIQVYAVHESKGYLAFTATKAEIEAVPAKPAVNTLIKQALGAQLWRLTNGNLEIRRGTDNGKVYSYQWSGC